MKVTVIGSRGCSKCKITKTLLEQKEIPFEYKIIEDLPEQDQNSYINKAQNAGMMSFPIIITNDEVVSLEEVIV